MSVTLRAWVSNKRIHVHQSGFSPESSSWLKALSPDSKWVGSKSEWEYPYGAGTVLALRDVATKFKFELVLSNDLEAELRRIDAMAAAELDTRKLVQKLLDDRTIKMGAYTTQPVPTPWWHQQVAWHWCMRVNVLYLAHKPGLGKTRSGADVVRGKIEAGQVRPPQHVPLARRYSTAIPSKVLPERWGIKGGVLVACPSVVVGEWRDQFKKWQNIEPLCISGSRERKQQRAGTKAWVHICSYDSLESVEHNEYDMILADEAHYLASDESLRWARMMSLRGSANTAIAMSGTPIPNMLQTLWAQYYWLDGGRSLGASDDLYRKMYFITSGRTVVEKENAETRVAQAISRITFNLTMQEAFKDKQEKITQVVRVPMTAEQANYYQKVRTSMIADVMSGQVSVGQALIKMGKLMQITQGFVFDDERIVQQFSSAKLKALEEMITGQGDFTDRKVIVWVCFKPEVDMVKDMLTRHKVPHLVLRGGQSESQRDELKRAWNNDPEPRVLIGMISMGIGLNLNAPMCVDAVGKPRRCSTTVFYGLGWKATQLEQAMDRTYRGDQVETCLYRFLLSDDLEDDDGNVVKPADVRVYETVLAKMDQSVRVSEESDDYVRMLLGM